MLHPVMNLIRVYKQQKCHPNDSLAAITIMRVYAKGEILRRTAHIAYECVKNTVIRVGKFENMFMIASGGLEHGQPRKHDNYITVGINPLNGRPKWFWMLYLVVTIDFNIQVRLLINLRDGQQYLNKGIRGSTKERNEIEAFVRRKIRNIDTSYNYTNDIFQLARKLERCANKMFRGALL
jgi:hypothetical protein